MAKQKTVTRRLGWRDAKPGWRLTLCRQVQGLKPGQSPVKLAEVELVDVRFEPLDAITAEDVEREGFPGWTPEQFVDFFVTHMKCTPDTEVTRLEWAYVEGDA